MRSGHTIVSLGKTHLLFGGIDAEKSEKKGKIGPNNQCIKNYINKQYSY